jgi:serine/threonine protein kinase
MSGPTPVSPLTTAGSIVGTIQYMSPEQIEGKEADARSDIFAFGAVLYEMATGKRAFQGKSQIRVASAILEKDPEPISRVSPLVLAAFDYLVASCLAKDREERFQTAHDVRLQLKGICAIFAVRGCDSAEPIFAHGRICRASAPRMVTTVACYAEWPSHLKRTSSAVGRKHYPER